MIRRGFVRFVLLALLFVGTVSLVGRRSFNAGWTQGYFASQETPAEAAPEAEAPPAAPQSPRQNAPGPRGYDGPGFFHFGWFLGGLLKFVLFLLLVGFVFRLLFGWRWHRRGPWGKRPFGWHHHGHGPYGPHHDPRPHEKSPEDVEPDIRSI